MTARSITVIVHGTFAAEADWWRLGNRETQTFADRLEQRMAQSGCANTVWKPALDAELDYADFTWSGRNRDKDRRVAAKRLASALEQVANRVCATAADPLTVHFVAHSHGGNVVLEVLRRLGGRVRAGGVVMLGTPLITVRPACRAARLVLSAAAVFLAIALGAFCVVELGYLAFTGEYSPDEQITVRSDGVMVLPNGVTLEEDDRDTTKAIVSALPGLVLFGWWFALAAWCVDAGWWFVCFMFRPFGLLRRRASGCAYGPSGPELRKSLHSRPILLLTTRNDEAELMLQIASAPAALYSEYVANQFSRTQRLLEWLFLRPFVKFLFLKVLEMALEVGSLGVSVWRALWFDYGVASGTADSYYPPQLLRRELVELAMRAPVAPAEAGRECALRLMPQPSGVLPSLRDVVEEFKAQIRLRHSGYYEDDGVLDRIVQHLVEATPSAGVVSPPSCRPSP